MPHAQRRSTQPHKETSSSSEDEQSSEHSEPAPAVAPRTDTPAERRDDNRIDVGKVGAIFVFEGLHKCDETKPSSDMSLTSLTPAIDELTATLAASDQAAEAKPRLKIQDLHDPSSSAPIVGQLDVTDSVVTRASGSNLTTPTEVTTGSGDSVHIERRGNAIFAWKEDGSTIRRLKVEKELQKNVSQAFVTPPTAGDQAAEAKPRLKIQDLHDPSSSAPIVGQLDDTDRTRASGSNLTIPFEVTTEIGDSVHIERRGNAVFAWKEVRTTIRRVEVEKESQKNVSQAFVTPPTAGDQAAEAKPRLKIQELHDPSSSAPTVGWPKVSHTNVTPMSGSSPTTLTEQATGSEDSVFIDGSGNVLILRKKGGRTMCWFETEEELNTSGAEAGGEDVPPEPSTTEADGCGANAPENVPADAATGESDGGSSSDESDFDTVELEKTESSGAKADGEDVPPEPSTTEVGGRGANAPEDVPADAATGGGNDGSSSDESNDDTVELEKTESSDLSLDENGCSSSTDENGEDDETKS